MKGRVLKGTLMRKCRMSLQTFDTDDIVSQQYLQLEDCVLMLILTKCHNPCIMHLGLVYHITK